MSFVKILCTSDTTAVEWDTIYRLISGLLEDEQLASAHQAETFSRQIQKLQGTDTHSDTDHKYLY